MNDASKHSALVVVDVQVDFCEGGVMAVPDSNTLFPALVEFIAKCEDALVPVIYTKDWHPPDHCSFCSSGGMWPPHCIQNSSGAELHPDIAVSSFSTIVTKGESRTSDGYSAFESDMMIKALGPDRSITVMIAGLALDYCVKATALDSIRHEYAHTIILTDLCRSIASDYSQVIVELAANGVMLLESGRIRI